jgi:hypothetical protein
LITAWRNKCRDKGGGRCRKDEDGCREQLHGWHLILFREW